MKTLLEEFYRSIVLALFKCGGSDSFAFFCLLLVDLHDSGLLCNDSLGNMRMVLLVFRRSRLTITTYQIIIFLILDSPNRVDLVRRHSNI